MNEHLGTDASSFHKLIEQIGLARFGHRPKVADVFCGSGQIPFEAACLGCDVYASDLNPIACMLTWGAFNIVGASKEKRAEIENAQKKLAEQVQKEIDAFGVETDGTGWRAKVYLYCVETTCPESGWKVPLIPTLIISKGYRVIARLVPVPEEKRYDVLRLWEKSDFVPRPNDIYQERLYCVQWMRKKPSGKGDDYQFRAVTADDLKREQKVIDYVGAHLAEWQEKGYVPDMVIEKGNETERLYRERGWTHWHHLWGSRQLLYIATIRKNIQSPEYYVFFSGALDYTSKLCQWATSGRRIAKDGSGKYIGGASDNPAHVFYNQALNTFFNLIP
ncbi:MAG: hypothetical protein ACMUJM_22840 [bacterium]